MVRVKQATDNEQVCMDHVEEKVVNYYYAHLSPVGIAN